MRETIPGLNPAISMDFNNTSHGNGREKHHFAAIDAALNVGVKHIYYTSLVFGSNSGAGVMQPHLPPSRTSLL